MDAVDAYARNHAEAWRHLLAGRTEEAGAHDGFSVLRTADPRETRVHLTRAAARVPDRVSSALSAPGRVSLDDPFGKLRLPEGFARTPRPVMVRGGTAAPVPAPRTRPEVGIAAVGGEEALLAVERLVVDGFPLPSRQPHTPQCFLPVGLLDAGGWRAWLATYRDSPASACLTFDHGGVVALYWLVTAPEHRSRGIARAVLSRVLLHHRGRDVVLVPTEDGRPLYDSLGFVEAGRGVFHTRTNAEASGR
ncbi:GNAT family N-acetyltransferase [Nocardiopsis akebiae]|uniref:GNAT family N-acetyltransferase n=1 Tax=Nocardiopsis akebiae TaxID=2831968 RepID=A0ABX8CAK4_9ACTN|nr:GNAT family N-acetyltransferase [Nocardiopsis akebiae]QUX31436.1 GNAT family N-acetyltransferase [Nocardiopsis akebiae]